MKLDRKQLVNEVEKMSSALEGSGMVGEQFSYLIFTKEALITYNQYIYIINKNLQVDFDCKVPAKEFTALIKKIKAKTIRIIYKKKSKKILVTTKSVEAEINCIDISKEDVEELASLRAEKIKYLKLPTNFKEAIKTCVNSASNDISQPELCSLFIDKEGVLSTDGFRITLYDFDEPVKTSFLLPAKSAKELLKNYSFKKYAASNNFVYFASNKKKLFFVVRTIDCDYPKNIIEHFDFRGSEIVLPKRMDFHLDLATVMLNEDMAQEDQLAEIIINEDGIKVRAEKAAGKVSSMISSSKLDKSILKIVKKKEIKFSANPNFLIDMLSKTRRVRVASDKLLFDMEHWKHLVATF